MKKKKIKKAPPKKRKVKAPKKKATKKPAKKPVKKPVKKISAKPVKDKKKGSHGPQTKQSEKTPEKPKFKLKPGEWITCYLALGSNVGDREEYIEQAITILRETPGIKVISRSSNYETAPEGGKTKSNFINAAVKINTNMLPDKLLEITQGIEDTLGRERGVEWGPRTIDVDILLYGQEVLTEDALTVPHPLMHERMFVLEPLKEIAPYVTHPILDRTISELYEDRKAEVSEKYEEDLSGFREVKRGIADDYERW